MPDVEYIVMPHPMLLQHEFDCKSNNNLLLYLRAKTRRNFYRSFILS